MSGFSLLEVLMCLTMLALIMLPFTLAMGSSAQNARGAYLQSTRTILLNSLKNETIPGDPNYVVNFTDASMNTSISDSGQTMGYRRTVDTTTAASPAGAATVTMNTTGMKRATLFYLYTNASDASSAPRYKTGLVSYGKVYRMRFGDNHGVIDTVGRYWFNDNSGNLVYNSGNKVPGWTTTHWTSNYWGNDIVNTIGTDDTLFQVETGGTTVSYSIDVDNAAYTVKILWCETNGGDTGSHPRRANIFLEGVQMNTTGPYGAYESTGGQNRAQIMMYDTTVSDGVLNLTISSDASSADGNVNPHGIEIIKRTMQ